MRKIIPVVAAGATALAVAGGTFGYATADKDVTLSVDGATSTVSTRAATVGDVLAKQGITLGAHDAVAPAAAAAVDDGTRIAVRYGRPLTVKVDGKPQTVWTTATNVDQALSALDLDTRGAALSTSRSSSIGRQGMALDVATLKTVKLTVAGHQRLVRTTARTVAQVLAAARITVDADDLLSVPRTTAVVDGTSLTVVKVDVRTLTKHAAVAYGTRHQKTGRLDKGHTSVRVAGKTGERTTTSVVTSHDGKVVSTRTTSNAVTTKPRTKVVLVGTHVEPKKVEAKKVEPKKAAHVEKKVEKKKAVKKVVKKKVVKRVVKKKVTKVDRAPSVASGGVWDKIAKCESGGNWQINTGNGFYGGLQFTKSTWHAFGGSGMPNHASRARQIAVAKKVKASQGWGAWPGCTSKLGLR